VFKADGSIDHEATAVRREEMRRMGLPVDQPISETLVPPPVPQAHEHSHSAEKMTEEERAAWAMSCRCCS
jgi:hypothetical protein